MKQETAEYLRALQARMEPEELQSLLLLFGGVNHSLPKWETLEREMRNAEMKAEWTAGATYKDLMKKYRMTERQVRRILDRKRNRAA